MTLEGCVEIDILDDSLSESWEVFSVQISTNTSAVVLLNTLIDVYIRPNDSKYDYSTGMLCSCDIEAHSKYIPPTYPECGS